MKKKWNPNQVIDNDGFEENLHEIGEFVGFLKHPVRCFSYYYHDELFESVDTIVVYPNQVQGHIVA